jgi:hydrogenase maturation factor
VSLPDDLASAALTLAQRFADSATMWCIAPSWPWHGRHVAVEFVHPVIIGKRALPAIHVDSADVVGAVRLLARPGDIVLAVSPADDPDAGAVLRRATPWGVTSVWIGAGARPAVGAADQIVWIDDVSPEHAASSGDIVMLYHLLWELTHVVFEHPGLLIAAASDRDEVGCVTCSDEGTVAEVSDVHEGGCADVVAGGHRETVDVSLVDPVTPGDLVLVHAGVALTVLPDSAVGHVR